MTALPIPSVSIEAVLARREKMRELSARIESTRRELEDMTGSAGIPAMRVTLDHRDRRDFTEKNAMREIDRELWSWMLNKSGLWSFMDHKARSDFREQYDKGEFPPLTAENVEDAFAQIHAQRGEMVARGVAELFRLLSNHHKTNKPNRFTSKLIVEYMGENWGGSLSVSHSRADLIDDLDRTLRVLRNLPELEHQTRAAWRTLDDAVARGGDRTADFDFFTVRLFKKGTGHIVFKHDSDVDHLNLMLAVATGGDKIAPEVRGR